MKKSPSPKDLAALAAEAERCANKLLTMHNLWRQAYYWLVVTSSVLAAVAGATALTQVWDGALAGALALIASALMAGAASLQPADRATGCGKKANDYLAVAREARQANEQSEKNGTEADKRKRYYELQERYDNIRTSPEPPLPNMSDSPSNNLDA